MSQPKTSIMITIVIQCLSDELSRLESLEGSEFLKHGIKACEAWWCKHKASLPLTLHYLTQHKINTLNERLQKLISRIPGLMDIYEPPKPFVVYQAPSQADLMSLKGAVAGNKEDQSTRLANMKQALSVSMILDTREYCSSLINHLPWMLVFEAIRGNSPEAALAFFNQIPADDALLTAILTCHSRDYVVDLITQCAKLKGRETASCGPDLVCQSRTFEVLIKDLMTTIDMNATCLHVNFGLPSHHARFETGANNSSCH